MTRYQWLADLLSQAMRDGRLAVGERLPSVRQAAQDHRVSINTVLAAYRQLEERGWVESRPKVGYFVRARLLAPEATRRARAPAAHWVRPVALDRIATVMEAQSDPEHIDLSLAAPRSSPGYPAQRLARHLAATARRYPELSGDYALPPGSLRLRQQIASHVAALGVETHPEQVILTNGCMEALQFALRAVTRPGDTVAIESPTYFNLIPLARQLGLKLLEVPTDPTHGMMLDALEHVLQVRKVAAVVVMPNVHNPLGTSMPVASKQRLAALAGRFQLPVIEDALFAELQFALPLAPAVKAFDRDGWVMMCSAYTKTLAPGWRVGWIEAGRFHRQVVDLKYCTSVAQPAVIAEALGSFLEHGGYAAHMRRLRRHYVAQIERLRAIVERHFPPGTRATAPTGGFLLWVELPAGGDADSLFEAALQRGISLTPGSLFSPSGRYRRHLRLSAAYPFTARHLAALTQLAGLARAQWQQQSSRAGG